MMRTFLLKQPPAKTLKQYIGQDKVKENLSVFIEAAKRVKKH